MELPNKIFYNPEINIPICWASEKKAKHWQQAAAETQTADNMLTFILAAEIRNVYLRLKLSHSVIYICLYCGSALINVYFENKLLNGFNMAIVIFLH